MPRSSAQVLAFFSFLLLSILDRLFDEKRSSLCSPGWHRIHDPPFLAVPAWTTSPSFQLPSVGTNYGSHRHHQSWSPNAHLQSLSHLLTALFCDDRYKQTIHFCSVRHYPLFRPAVSQPSTDNAGQTWQRLQTCLKRYYWKARTTLFPTFRPKVTSVAFELAGECVAGFCVTVLRRLGGAGKP